MIQTTRSPWSLTCPVLSYTDTSVVCMQPRSNSSAAKTFSVTVNAAGQPSAVTDKVGALFGVLPILAFVFPWTMHPHTHTTHPDNSAD